MRKRNYTIPSMFIAMFFLSSCAFWLYTPENLPSDRLEFGYYSEGSVEKTYSLLKNGQLFVRYAGEDQFKTLDNVDKAIAKSVYAKFDSLNFLSYDMISSSESFYFITQLDDFTDHSLRWEKDISTAPEEIIDLYNSLVGIIPQNKQALKEKSEKKENTGFDGW